ncbi:MAG: AAA family ATPase [Actinomyces graevenitzii]|nr:AAA family ATPase [Actinomyces graevenitzii]
MITLTIGPDGSGSYEDENGVEPLAASNSEQLRALLLGKAASRARAQNQVVSVTARDTSGVAYLLVSPSGAIKLADKPPTQQPAPPQATPAPDLAAQVLAAYQTHSQQPVSPQAPAPLNQNMPQPAPQPVPQQSVPGQPVAATQPLAQAPTPPPVVPSQQPVPQPVPQQPVPQQSVPQPVNQPVPGQGVQVSAPVLRARPDSFLAKSAAGGPKPTGWRAVAGRLGFKVQASQAQCQQWEDERTVSQHWPGPRTIAVLNGKGGAGKTPTSILLASNFARLGSGSVVAADGNVTRGTLGWRTEQGPHNATILDMVPQTEALMDPSARNGDVAAYTHHQTIDQFDVLRSNPLLLSTEQKLSPKELDGIQQVLTRYYRMIIWDTGNDEGDSLWLRIVSHADQIVIATTTRTDHAEAGRLLLQGLSSRDERSAALAANAVVVISQADREEPPATSLVDGFAGIAREVVTIPYDRSMREQWLRSDKLAPATRAAWLHAAAAVARGL